jgi:solute:Na+ symporter, SSS family
VRACGNMPQGQEALVWVLNAAVPPAAGVIMSLGLLSAIVSSADTCLITASVILSRQIKQDPPLWAIRAATMGIAAAALVIAWLKADIISTLLLSYSVFNCGVIAPLFLAIIFAGKKRLNEKIAIISILVGGLLGLYANFSQHKQSLAIIAFTASAIIAFIAIVPVKQPKCCK